MNQKLLVSPSPHIHSGDSIEKNMYRVVLALIPALIASVIFFGWNALFLSLISIASCVAFEFLIGRFMMGQDGMSITDGSAIITGLLLGLNLPSELPWWIVVIGALVAIGIGKMAFGGIGANIFNPAILGRVFLLVSFPQQMTTWPRVKEVMESAHNAVTTASMDAVSSATPLATIKGIASGNPEFPMQSLGSLRDLFLGQVGGSLGEVSAVALILGGIYLLIRKVITWEIPVSILVTVFVFAGVMHLVNPTLYVSPMYHLLSGGLLIGAIFMATDYSTSPMTRSGQILYGVCIGLLTMLIRLFGSYPEGMSFAILVMNAFTPMINRFSRPHLFGQVRGEKQK